MLKLRLEKWSHLGTRSDHSMGPLQDSDSTHVSRHTLDGLWQSLNELFFLSGSALGLNVTLACLGILDHYKILSHLVSRVG